MFVRLLVVAVAAVGLSGCGSDSSGLSKAAVCGQALGTVVLSEVGDDARRRAQQAKDAADTLSRLASQTQDQSLSSALNAAAAQAREATTRQFDAGGLEAWAAKEEQRFAALQAACS